MTGINLCYVLTKWGPSLKIAKDYLRYESNICSTKYMYNLSGLDCMGMKQNLENKKIGKQIRDFYKTVFLKNDHMSIDRSVNSLLPFFLLYKIQI